MILTAINLSTKEGFLLTKKNNIIAAVNARFLTKDWIITNDVNALSKADTSLRCVNEYINGKDAVIKGVEFIDEYSVKIYSKDGDKLLPTIHINKQNSFRVEHADGTIVMYIMKTEMSHEQVCYEFSNWKLQQPISSTAWMLHAKDLFIKAKGVLTDSGELSSVHSKDIIGYEIERESPERAKIVVYYKTKNGRVVKATFSNFQSDEGSSFEYLVN